MLRLICCATAIWLAPLHEVAGAETWVNQTKDSQIEAMTRGTDEAFGGRQAEYLLAVWAEDDVFWAHVAQQRPELHKRANVVITQIVSGRDGNPVLEQVE